MKGAVLFSNPDFGADPVFGIFFVVVAPCDPPRLSGLDEKALLSGLSAEDKRETTSFMGSVDAKTRNALQVCDMKIPVQSTARDPASHPSWVIRWCHEY